jgi:hypothetical protein
MGQQDVTPAELSDFTRLFDFAGHEPEPSEGQSLVVWSKAGFDAEIVSLDHGTSLGSMDVLVEIGGVTVEFAGADTAGKIVADAGAQDNFAVDSTDSGNYRVVAGQQIVFTFSGLDTGGVENYQWTLHLRRLKEPD